MVVKAMNARDWPGVLRWESQLEELFTLSAASQPQLLNAFASANMAEGHFAKAASLFEKSAELLGKLERFSSQGEAMCRAGECFLRLNDAKGGEKWYQKAQKLGEKLGCLDVECRASFELGRLELHSRGHKEQAEELFRHALSVLDYVEGPKEPLERDIKQELVKVLMQTGRHEEAWPLIQCLRELAVRASCDPLDMVTALQLTMIFHETRGDRE